MLLKLMNCSRINLFFSFKPLDYNKKKCFSFIKPVTCNKRNEVSKLGHVAREELPKLDSCCKTNIKQIKELQQL